MKQRKKPINYLPNNGLGVVAGAPYAPSRCCPSRGVPEPLLTVGDVHHVHATGVGRRDTINQVQGPEAVAAYQKYDFFQVDIFLVKCKYI